jgi:hypothetical protein
MSELLQKIYTVFNPVPLKQGQKELYVNLDDVRGSVGIVEGMARKIRLADEPTCQVLTGHRGSGKSTELWRLRHVLQEPDDGQRFFTVSVMADDHLDRNDVDFPDVLIAIVREVAAQLQNRLNISLKPGYFRDRWRRLKKLAFSEVDIDSVSLEAGMAELSAKIKHSPDARLEIRKLLDPDADNWLKAANEVLGDAVQQLQKQDYRGLVVIVDGLDKMIVRKHEKADCLTTEYLFVHRAGQLTAFQCHVVYAMPLELAYSRHEQKIKGLYGGSVPVLPMIKVAKPPPSTRSHKDGVDRFREIIDVRLASVGAEENDLFSTDRVRSQLIKLSGGQPDELMRMVREAIITDGLPISTGTLRRCEDDAQRTYLRMFRLDHWPILESVRETGNFVRTLDNDDAIRELLESRAILQYRNSKEWYALNPAIDDLYPPEPPSPEESPEED